MKRVVFLYKFCLSFVALLWGTWLHAAVILGQPNLEFPMGFESYGAGELIESTQYDAVALRRGDSVFLMFPIAPVMIQPNPLVQSSIAGNIVTLILGDSVGTGSLIHTSILLPDFTYTFTIRVLGDVWPGDANADGRRNMKDLLPIALGIRKNMPPRNASFQLLYPPQVDQMRLPVDVTDWHDQNGPVELQVGGRTVNCKHADCNLDGRIDQLDVEYLMAVLTPLAQNAVSRYLMDEVNGIGLQATIEALPLSAAIIGDVGDPTKPMQIGLDMRFKINLVNVPPGSMDSIAGIIFSRPIFASSEYSVGHTEFSTEASEVFDPLAGKDILRRQRLWNLLRNFNTGSPCANSVEMPLDVGICVLKGPLTLATDGALVGNCTVTLLDVLRSTAGQPISLEQFIVNGQIAIVRGNTTEIQNVRCVSDNTSIYVDVLCRQPPVPVMRDGFGDRGSEREVSDSTAWNSPDIWVRHQNDEGLTSQNPIPGDTEIVNVRVFNYGCRKLEGVKVKVYWGHANTAMAWPQDFSNAQGGLIGTIIIPIIEPWGSAIGKLKWGVPGQPAGNSNGRPVFTLLAGAIVPGDTIPDFSNLRQSVLSRKNVAARSSIALLDDHQQSIPATINLRNPNSNQGPVRLCLTQIGGPAEIAPSKFGNLELFKVSAIATPPQLQNMTLISASSEAVYRMAANEIQGSIDFTIDPLAIDPTIGIRFIPHSSNPGGPIKYLYKLTMLKDGIIYNSSIFEINVPGH